MLTLSLIASTPALGGTATPREVSVQAGAYAPIFFIYETPGFVMSADFAWRMTPEVSVDAATTAGLLAAPGLRRSSAVVTAGLRYHVIPALWLRLGAGAAGYREHIALALTDRAVRAVDHGGALVVTTGFGVHLGQRWRLDARFDTNVVASRGMDFLGTATLLVGRQL